MRCRPVLLLAVAQALLATACASAPQLHDYDNTFTLQASLDDTWEAVIDVFGESNWPIDQMERASGFISTDWLRAEDHHLDCGGSGITVTNRHQVRFNLTVREIRPGEAQLTVNTTMQAYRSFGNSGNWIECTSRGSIEAFVHDRVLQRLDTSFGR